MVKWQRLRPVGTGQKASADQMRALGTHGHSRVSARGKIKAVTIDTSLPDVAGRNGEEGGVRRDVHMEEMKGGPARRGGGGGGPTADRGTDATQVSGGRVWAQTSSIGLVSY
jgi:hypothetical protein